MLCPLARLPWRLFCPASKLLRDSTEELGKGFVWMTKKLNKRVLVLQIAVAVAAALFVGYGVYREEVDIVLNKAINICFECIGLG